MPRPVVRLLVHGGRLEDGEIAALDAHALVREEQIVLIEAGADAGDEQDRLRVLGVAKLDERALRPLAALEVELLAQGVEALRAHPLERLGPGQAPELDRRAV